MSNRPLLHLTAPHNWLSDPNGPVQVDGEYHVFYQYNPAAPEWGLMHWGHASSTDLLKWTPHPIALFPDAGGPDADGCWSGCIRLVDGVYTAFYTGASGTGAEHRQVVLRAEFGPGLLLPRGSSETVVPAATGEAATHQQRDPFLLRYDETWLMLLGTGISRGPSAGQGAVVMWASTDTVNWTERGTLLSLPRDAADVDLGPVWECPQMFRVGDDWVLIVSVQLPGTPQPECPYAVWFVGDFEGAFFEPRASGVLDAGHVFYAPALTAQTADRHLLWGWIQEDPSLPAPLVSDFAGVMSFPRELTVVDGRVVTRPAREVEDAWSSAVARATPRALAPGEQMVVVAEVGGTYRVRVSGTGPLVMTLPGGVSIGVCHGEPPTGLAHVRARWLRLNSADAAVRLDVLVDQGVVEAFADGATPLTLRVTPTNEAASEFALFSPTGGAVESFEIDTIAG